MALTTKRVQVIDEVDYGIYLWRLPDGRYISDGEGHYYMLAAKRDDKKAIQLLTDAVKSEFGIEEGYAFFMAGNRPVTDEEWDEQRRRDLMGLIPDPQDMPAHLDRLKHAKQFGE